MEEATDEIVEQWFNKRLNSAPKDISERFRSAIDSVSYLNCKDDPSGVTREFLLKIITALDKNNASEVVKDSENRRA